MVSRASLDEISVGGMGALSPGHLIANSLLFRYFLGRLQPLITTTENPPILVILYENEAIGGIQVLT